MKQLLNRTTAPQVIGFFDACFKQGVIDACELGSDLDAREFLESKKEDWSFGTLGVNGEYDWQDFRYWAYRIARLHRMKSLADGYLFRIRNKSYPWCILPYSMRFYLMGIQEWLNYPNPVGIEVFKATLRIHWDPNEKNKKITKPDIISYLHEFEFEYRNIQEEERPVSDSMMSGFVQAVYDLSRKYV